MDTTGSPMTTTIFLKRMIAYLLHDMKKVIMPVSPGIRAPQQNYQVCSRDLISTMPTVPRRECDAAKTHSLEDTLRREG